MTKSGGENVASLRGGRGYLWDQRRLRGRVITPGRRLADFEEAGFKDTVKPLILKRNAMRLLNLDEQKAA